MKTVKITLAVAVVAAITAAAIFGFMSLSNSDEIQKPKNQFADTIELKIDSLKRMPESSFCKKIHDEIKYYIEDDYTNNRLGNTQSENDQRKKDLSSNLYVAYADKFIKQAFYVFKGSEWDVKKLNFIRTEYKTLQNDGKQAGILEINSITNSKFEEIKNIFAKYDEITGFINSCKTFSFSNYDDLYTGFPISKVQNKISRSKDYLKNKLENDYVKNCKRLETSFKDVPQILFNAHVKYLDNKITFWSGKYLNSFFSQLDYNNRLFTPLLSEIDGLDNAIYNVGSLDAEYDRLRNKLYEDGNAAYLHFK